MNRRFFLGSLLATATLDPERLLWVPGKKLISIPKPRLAALPGPWFRTYVCQGVIILQGSFDGTTWWDCMRAASS